MLSSTTSRSAALPRILFMSGVGLVLIIIISQAIGGSGTDSANPGYLSSGIDVFRTSLPGRSIKKRLQHAEHLWQKSVDERHEMYDNYDDPQKDMFPAKSVPAYFTFPFTIWDFFPATFNCPHDMERVGRMGDGGKWTCGMSRYETASRKRPCVAYSFGVQNESSYEEALLQRTKCEVFGIDFSVSEFGPQLKALGREENSRAHFLQAGISGKSDLAASPPYYNIQDLMESNGHEYIDILKMDIEGFEFDSMDSLTRLFDRKGEPLPIGQLQVEIHIETHIDGLTSMMKWWEKLEAGGLRPVWTEPNLLQVTLGLDDGMPRYAEYTFINVKNKRNVLLSD